MHAVCGCCLFKQNSGSFELTIKENTGDSAEDPLTIPSLPFVYDGTTTDYTNTIGIDSSCLNTGKNYQGSKDIFFQYFSPRAQSLNVSTCGTTTDTIVTVFSGTADKLNKVQCNDDASRTECGSASEIEDVVSHENGTPPYSACTLYIYMCVCVRERERERERERKRLFYLDDDDDDDNEQTLSGLTYYYVVVQVLYTTSDPDNQPDSNFRLEINTSLRP